MSVMASARVPNEIYDQGILSLEKIGSTPSELITSAFAYVAQTGKLPCCNIRKSAVPTENQLKELELKLAKSCLHLDLPESWDYREEIAEGKAKKYEITA